MFNHMSSEKPMTTAAESHGSEPDYQEVVPPEPWMLASYFHENWRLDPEQRKSVEAYLRTRPLVRKTYEGLIKRRQSQLEKALSHAKSKKGHGETV